MTAMVVFSWGRVSKERKSVAAGHARDPCVRSNQHLLIRARCEWNYLVEQIVERWTSPLLALIATLHSNQTNRFIIRRLK